MSLILTPRALQQYTDGTGATMTAEDLESLAFVQYMMAAYTLCVGLVYCFYGAKVFSYVHSAVCFLYTFMLLFEISGAPLSACSSRPVSAPPSATAASS